MILTVTPNPCVDKTLFVDTLEPGQSYRMKRYTTIAGGKGVNVSRAAIRLGGRSKALVVVGGRTGEHVLDMIRADGIEAVPCRVASPTRTISTILEEKTLRQTVLFEPGSRVTEMEEAEIRSAFEGCLEDASAACFNGVIPEPRMARLYRDLIETAKDREVLTVLDSHGPAFAEGMKARPAVVKPNVREAEEFLGRVLDSEEKEWKAVDAFLDMGAKTVLLSRGAGGIFASDGADFVHVKPPAVDEVNAVGSGDALLAGFLVTVESGGGFRDACVCGVAAGTANAMEWDIGTFSLSRVARIAKEVKVRERYG